MDTKYPETADDLLQHLLNELDQKPSTATRNMSGKDVNMAKVVRSFYDKIPDIKGGRELFTRYAMAFLDHNHHAADICEKPEGNHYVTPPQELRDYRNKPWQTKQKILRCLASFGEHLILRCIYPVMARPDHSTPSTGASEDRLQQFRNNCLRREGHRCVVTGKFYIELALARSSGEDDDGNPLSTNPEDFRELEVAHIIPHALGWKQDSDAVEVSSRMNVLAILDMFAPGSLADYHGTMDSPRNGMSMVLDTHKMFEKLRIFFEHVQDTEASYIVNSVDNTLRPFTAFPKNVTFRNVTDVPLPDRNPLVIHRACARIGDATGAAESCMRFFSDLEEGAVSADSSSPLDRLVAYQLYSKSGTDQQEYARES